MTVAPKPGKYIIGDPVNDTHTHVFYIGEHPLDVEFPDDNASLIAGDFPKATASSFYYPDFNEGPHAHSMTADPNVDETLICGLSNDSRFPHTHTMITKVVD